MPINERQFRSLACAVRFSEKVGGEVSASVNEEQNREYTVTYSTENNLCRICGKRECYGLLDVCHPCYVLKRYYEDNPEAGQMQKGGRAMKIDELLMDESLSQSEIAKRVGVSRQYISLYLKNKMKRERKVMGNK